MAYWVRKITRSKWPDELISINTIPADVITSELRTQKNTLSFWRIETLDDLEKAALALAASSKSTKIETIDIVYIPEDEFQSAKLETCITPGDTVVPDLAGLHRDLSSLNYSALGVISSIIHANMKHENAKRYTKKAVKALLVKAFRENRISQDKCDPSVYSEIENAAG